MLIMISRTKYHSQDWNVLKLPTNDLRCPNRRVDIGMDTDFRTSRTQLCAHRGQTPIRREQPLVYCTNVSVWSWMKRNGHSGFYGNKIFLWQVRRSFKQTPTGQASITNAHITDECLSACSAHFQTNKHDIAQRYGKSQPCRDGERAARTGTNTT